MPAWSKRKMARCNLVPCKGNSSSGKVFVAHYRIVRGSAREEEWEGVGLREKYKRTC